jgi:hypothetical protein
MTFFDLLFFLIMGFCLYTIAKGAIIQRNIIERKQMEEDLGLEAQKEALLAQPYYYYELVKDNIGGKQYLLYNVTDNEYVGQAATLGKLKKLVKDLHPEYENVFLKNPSTNKISVI